MITLISPAKTLDLSTSTLETATQPDFQKETFELVGVMKKQKTEDLIKLMGISEKLAELNAVRYKNFQKTFDSENSN